jgi:hypothetical protein
LLYRTLISLKNIAELAAEKFSPGKAPGIAGIKKSSSG